MVRDFELAETEARLKNWAYVYRDRLAPNVSPTYTFCQALKAHHQSLRRLQTFTPSPARYITTDDQADADLVNETWKKMDEGENASLRIGAERKITVSQAKLIIKMFAFSSDREIRRYRKLYFRMSRRVFNKAQDDAIRYFCLLLKRASESDN